MEIPQGQEMLVTIEGSDFSGKSTIADALAESLRVHDFEVSRIQVMLVQGWFEAFVRQIQERPWVPAMFRSAAFNVACVVDVLLYRDRRGTVTIQESCLLRVQAHNLVRERKVFAAVLGRLLRISRRPDVAIYLRCSFEERRSRWQTSSSSDVRDQIRFNSGEALNRRLDAALEALACSQGFTLIDTEQHSVGVIVENLFNEIWQRRKER